MTFLVRIPLPIGYVFQPLNLQVSFLPQYIGLFFLGLAAYYGDWLNKLKSCPDYFWRYFTLVLISLMPLLFILSGGLKGDVTPALGGLHWQSLAYSLWEQLFCLSMLFTLLQYFKTRDGTQGKLVQELAASSYAVYFFHAPVLVIFTSLLHGFEPHPLLKILILTVPALTLCFLSGSLFRRLPGLRSVL